MSMALRISSIFFITFICVQSHSQELIYNAFLQDSVAVGETVDFYITLDQKEIPQITELGINSIDDIQFYSATSQSDTIKVEKADINVNSYGLWEDKDKDGVLRGDELKWEKVQNGDTILYRNKLSITFFDVGIYVFNGFPYQVNGQSAQTNRALMKVTFKDYDLAVVDSTGLAPIKDIIKEGISIQDFLPYLLYIVLPLILIYLGYRYWKSLKKEESLEKIQEVIYIPPDVQALQDLKELKHKELWQKGEIKQYQSELSHIIREYLEGRYDIKALENTTSQIIKSIDDKSFTAEDQVKLKRILQISDLVKFAKAKPEVNIHEEFMNDAVNFVQNTRKSVDLNDEEE